MKNYKLIGFALSLIIFACPLIQAAQPIQPSAMTDLELVSKLAEHLQTTQGTLNLLNIALTQNTKESDADLEQQFAFSYKAGEKFILANRLVQAKVLNAYLSVEHFDYNDAMTTQVRDCLFQDIPIICSAALLNRLLTISDRTLRIASRAILSTNLWTVFINKEKDIAIIVPRTNPDSAESMRQLKKNFGLNLFGLNPIKPENVASLFSQQEYKEKPVIIEHIRDIFDTSMSKRFYLSGHGGLGQSIAAISLIKKEKTSSHFEQFLKLLSEINTQFIYINTCFSGGLNLDTMQQQIQEMIETTLKETYFTEKKSPSYAIAIQATTDAPTSGSVIALKEFFVRLNVFLLNPHWYLGKSKAKETMTITKVVEPLYHPYPHISSLPAIRFPGQTSFFRTIDLDKMTIITWHAVQKMLLEEILSPVLLLKSLAPEIKTTLKKLYSLERQIPFLQDKWRRTLHESQQHEQAEKELATLEQQIAEVKSSLKLFSPNQEAIINIPDLTKYVLIYPVDLTKIIIDIEGTNRPRFISKIGGQSNHFIKEIRINTRESLEATLKSFVKTCFAEPFHIIGQPAPSSIKEYYFGSSKTWFIKTLSINFNDNKELLNNVAINVVPTQDLTDEEIKIYFKQGNGYKKINSMYSQIMSAMTESIKNEDDFLEGLSYFFDKTQVLESALFEATAGNENKKTEELAFLSFFAPLKYSIASGDLHAIKNALDRLDINKPIDHEGNTLLTFAVQQKQRSIVQFLLGNPHININQRNSPGDSPLHIAVKQKDLPMVTLLLANKHKPNLISQDESGKIPLTRAFFISHVEKRIKNAIVKALIEADDSGKSLEFASSRFYPIHFAVFTQDPQMVKLMLTKKPDLVKSVDRAGQTALQKVQTTNFDNEATRQEIIAALKEAESSLTTKK